ncbi:hypothetical protein [Burkholderia latens]|uniref:Uncharacterized protein n=1 Tax=Burkholderia latens TaxID=488446 RepID=A0A6H9SXL6_9BURK|nr:hypothetical protein [Burkholderia latens]KAB0639016.1 hypothetical protein F7R21_18930 [Burkholderia latens]
MPACPLARSPLPLPLPLPLFLFLFLFLLLLLSALFAVCRLPFAVCRLPFAVCRVPYAVCRMPYAVCRMPYAVCRVPVAITAGCHSSLASGLPRFSGLPRAAHSRRTANCPPFFAELERKIWSAPAVARD